MSTGAPDSTTAARPAAPTSIDAYLQALEAGHRLAGGTLRNRRRELARLLDLAPGEDAARFDRHRLRLLLARLHAQGLQAKTLAHTLSVWRGYYQWLAAQGAIGLNPALGLRAPRAARPLPKALSVDDAHALAEHPPSGGVLGLRDRAIVELLYSSALRRAELALLDWRAFKEPDYQSQAWLDLEAGEVQVLGKGGRRRVVPVGAAARSALQQWLERRAELLPQAPDADARAALFLGARGRRLTPGMVYHCVVAAARAAGSSARVHPHVLRHSAASHLLQSSGDLRAVQEFLGHAQIGTTQIYTRLDWQHLAAAYDAAHPRAQAREAAPEPTPTPTSKR